MEPRRERDESSGGRIKRKRFLSWLLTMGRILNTWRLGKEEEEVVTLAKDCIDKEWKYGNMLRVSEEKEISR